MTPEKVSLDKKIDIEKAIKRLDKNQQIAVKMYFYQNATFADIGKKLNLSSGRARQILGKALRRLKHPALGLVEDAAAVNTGSIPNPAQTAMGPSRLPVHIFRRRVGKEIHMTDRRRRKDKTPVLLKKFRKYMEDNG